MAADPKLDDPRMGSLLLPAGGGADVVLLGFPWDEGATRNGGRPGAAGGAAAFRRFLPRMGSVVNCEFGLDISGLRLWDGGDAGAGAGSLEEAHADLEERAAAALAAPFRPLLFVIGGSNDQSCVRGRGRGRVCARARGRHGRLRRSPHSGVA